MEMFRDCGWPSWIMLLLALLSVVVGLVATVLAFAKPRWGVIAGAVALAVSCSVPGTGALGMAHGRHIAESAVAGASIDPSQRQRILEEGYREAGQCTTLGLGMGALPLLLALAALGVGAARRK